MTAKKKLQIPKWNSAEGNRLRFMMWERVQLILRLRALERENAELRQKAAKPARHTAQARRGLKKTGPQR